MTEINVCQLITQHADDFFALRLEALQTSPTSFTSSYEEESVRGVSFFRDILQKNDPRNFIMGAFVGERLVGCAGVYPETHIKLQHKGNLWGVYVTPDFRQQGVADQLLAKAIQQATPHFKQLCLSVAPTNAGAVKLYQHHGFVAWGTEPQAMLVDGVLYDEMYMTLFLN